MAMLLLILSFPSTHAAPTLTEMSVSPATIVASGFSSGGCFATQFHTAFSASVAGVGVFSGCPYLSGAVGFNVEDILAATRQLAADQAIDPLEGLQGDQVYIFQGIQDPIVPWSNAALIHSFYSEFTAEADIEEKSDLEATHGVPSDSYGCACNTLCPYYYINNCQYSGAQAVVSKTLPAPAGEVPRAQGRLTEFDQQEFYDGDAENHSMEGEGFIYTPARCAEGRQCHLHLHFHGCGMGSGWIGDSFIRNSGFLAVADASDMILLFPQVRPLASAGNGNGCWDWWGYLGEAQGHAFATKAGRQMKGVAAMVERVAGIPL